MKVKISSDLSGEMQFNMSAENYIQLIGAATRYAADDPAAAVYETAKDAVQEYAKQPEKKLEKPVSKVERMFGDVHSRIPISSVLPEVKRENEGYKGFLLIQCEDCGQIKGFCTKSYMRSYFCVCGCETKLEALRPLFLNCKKCGERFKYYTNVSERQFSYFCKHCGRPADLELNRKGDAFVTVSDLLRR